MLNFHHLFIAELSASSELVESGWHCFRGYPTTNQRWRQMANQISEQVDVIVIDD